MLGPAGPLSTPLQNLLYSLIGVGVSGSPLSTDRGGRPPQVISSVMWHNSNRDCHDICTILLWSVEHILKQSTPNFYQISNLIEILWMGQGEAYLWHIYNHIHSSSKTTAPYFIYVTPWLQVRKTDSRIKAILLINPGNTQGSFWVWAQPMRDDVTM